MLCNAHVHTYVVTIRIRPTRELGGNVWKMGIPVKKIITTEKEREYINNIFIANILFSIFPD